MIAPPGSTEANDGQGSDACLVERQSASDQRILDGRSSAVISRRITRPVKSTSRTSVSTRLDRVQAGALDEAATAFC
jgi:hypothetical protein